MLSSIWKEILGYQASIWIMPCALSKRAVRCCTALLHCLSKSHCSPYCSRGNSVHQPSTWHRPLFLHPGWIVLAWAVSSAGTCSLSIPTCGNGEDESYLLYPAAFLARWGVLSSCFLFVIRKSCITSFRNKKQGDFTEVWEKKKKYMYV